MTTRISDWALGDGLDPAGSCLGLRRFSLVGALLWAFCHFIIILQYLRVQSARINRPAGSEREPLFHGVSSWTSSSPADGWGSLAQRDVTMCVRFSTLLSCVVMLSVCETYLLCAAWLRRQRLLPPCLTFLGFRAEGSGLESPRSSGFKR